MQKQTIVMMLSSALGCSAGTACVSESANVSRCEEASSHLLECVGVEMGECNEDIAANVLAKDCAELVEESGSGVKADGWSCPSYLSWLCGPSPYDAFSPEEKLAFHWQQGLESEYGANGNSGYPRGVALVWDGVQSILTGFPLMWLERAFTNSTDQLDRGRKKFIHPYGSLVQIELGRDPDHGLVCATEYTGLWSEDSVTGLARLGWGQDPRLVKNIPGMGVKFFVPGQPSVNLHLIHALDGVDEPNFFGLSLSNSLPNPVSASIKGLAKYFGRIANNPLHLRLEHLAKVTSNGESVSDWHAPYQIVLQPTDEAVALYDAALQGDSNVDFRDAFKTFPAGTAIYEIDTVTESGCREHWGTMRTVTRFVASSWGDERLQFQHATEGQGIE